MMTSALKTLSCIPRLYAAASLKHRSKKSSTFGGRSIPRLYAAASLKQCPRVEYHSTNLLQRIPRLYAAASLKPRVAEIERAVDGCIPRLYAAASLKRSNRFHKSVPAYGIPRLYAAASLKRGAGPGRGGYRSVFRGFMPRPH